MAADKDVLAIAWGETWGLSPKDGKDETRDRLRAVVAQLAQAAKSRGLDYLLKKRLAPRGDQENELKDYNAVVACANSALSTDFAPQRPMPARAVLWEINDSGAPRRDPPPPKGAGWIFGTDFTPGGDFVAGDGPDQRTFRLFESTASPGGDELPYYSGYTDSGVNAAIASSRSLENRKKVAWGLGILSAVAFVFGGLSATWSGRGDGEARSLMTATDKQYVIVDKLADNCIADAKFFANRKRAACAFLDGPNGYAKPAAQQPPPPPGATGGEVSPPPAPSGPPATPLTAYGPKVGDTIALIDKCLNLGGVQAPAPSTDPSGAPGQPPGANAAAEEAASCDLIARSAAGVVVLAKPRSALDAFAYSLMGLRNVANTGSVVVQFVLMALGIAGLAIALGLGTKGQVVGIWIDERNRVSLARAQVTLWTIVALGGFAATALYNIGLGAPVTFPQIPASIAAALGIAFVSPMLSSLILDKQSFADPGSPLGRMLKGERASGAIDPPEGETLGALETRAGPEAASLADVFVGEHVKNAGQVDVSRLQNVVLTVTLLLGYLGMLIGQLGNIAPGNLLAGLSHMPDAGGTFTSVLLVSHAAYLGTKAYAGAGAGMEQR